MCKWDVIKELEDFIEVHVGLFETKEETQKMIDKYRKKAGVVWVSPPKYDRGIKCWRFDYRRKRIVW